MNALTKVKGERRTYVTNPCPHCGKVSTVRLKKRDRAGFRAWKRGEYVEIALPHWSPARRQLLISGIHVGECWWQTRTAAVRGPYWPWGTA